MENAGRALALVAWRRFLAHVPDCRVTVLAVTGGNGGGALAAARRLACWGARVEIVLARPSETLTPVPARQLAALRAMGLDVSAAPGPRRDLILDGLVGYSLNGAPSGRVANLINWANAQPVPTLALDVPSGFDTARGRALSPSIRAHATVTLALPKTGMTGPDREPSIGDLYLVDISVPPGLYGEMGWRKPPPPFGQGDILRIG